MKATPPPSEEALRELRERASLTLKTQLTDLPPDVFAEWMDETTRQLLKNSFEQIAADEGTVWLHDDDAKVLRPIYNTGIKAGAFVGSFEQPEHAGIISMVFSTEQPFLENQMDTSLIRDSSLDQRLDVKTESLIATPFHLLGHCAGVISAVQLSEKSDQQRSFSSAALDTLTNTAILFSRAVEWRLFSNVLGL